MRPTNRLRQLLRRKNKVLAVLGAPNAFHAKIMEAHGVEACFVGTSITGGNYTGMPDLGVLTMPECVGAGLAGLRLDDQPLEQKRRTMSTGISIVSRAEAVARYRAAVDARDEIDPGFVIMAQR